MLTLNKLKINKRKRTRRVGRGNASGRGTYAGRGQKGQKARSGGRKGLKLFGLRQTFQKIHKAQGFASLYPKLKVINLSSLEKAYKDGAKVDLTGYKVLGGGELKKKLTIFASAFSKKAEEAIKKAGGKTKKCGTK